MPRYTILDKFIIYKGEKAAEEKFRKELSRQLLEKFGRGPFEATTLTDILRHSVDYYVMQFQNICRAEKSFNFYRLIFWLHEQVTEAAVKHSLNGNIPKEITGQYVASYRRTLKFILEMGCEVQMIPEEPASHEFHTRCERTLDDLLFLGEMILTCVDLYAEQTMIDDVLQLVFDKEDLYVFSRKHQYEYIFQHIIKEIGAIATKQVSDDRAIEGFTTALKNCFNIGFADVGHIIASWQEQLYLSDGDPIVVPAGDFALNLTQVYHVPAAIAEQFLTGLRLDRNNKMSLHDLACRPHNMNRFLYRPILIWNIDGSDFSVIGKNSWTEAIIQLTTNAIPWGKASKEWLKNSCFKEYVHSKEDAHDSWLDDEVEEHLISLSLLYDRNVKQIRGIGHCFRIDAPDLGEIDFIIIAPAVKKIFIADCKHLLGRYDIVNQRNDYNVFAVGSTHSNSYNVTLAKKLAWFNENKGLLEEHFQLKYNDTTLSFDGFNFEGIFIINSPTFYMYNSEYRIYMVNQLPEVLNGTFQDSIFFLRVGEGDNEKLISVTYPYFRKPTYIEFDHFLDDEPGE